MRRFPSRLTPVLLAVLALALAGLAQPAAAENWTYPRPEDRTVRFATFNTSLNRTAEGELIENLSEPYDGTDPDTSDEALRRWQAANVAEVIQRTRPDVLLLNEFDYDAGGEAIDAFRSNYLQVGQNGADPIDYPYVFLAESNTGLPSGVDLDNSGTIGGPGDAYGFGLYPGQFAMVVLSKYPIRTNKVRTFQEFLWKDMPDNLIPTDFYSEEAVDALRLSSKSHWDVPIRVQGRTIHFLVSHPTPPVFDGPEDRNGRRNHDEIRFWADYVKPRASRYIYDDEGRRGGLSWGARFVIAGDQNADPLDGDSTDNAIDQLLHNWRIQDPGQTSLGGSEAAALQGGANAEHQGDPALDTADFADTAPGNLRVDYVLPSRWLRVRDAGVFWPESTDPLSRLTGQFDFGQFQRDGIGYPTSDHRLVWVDVTTRRW
ncbi:MAG: endonuclease/exonuclease/phosphatase family protein [Actinomycetota bacterium]